MKHTQLPDAGLTPHHEIDRLLQTIQGQAPLSGDLALSYGQAIYFLGDGVTDKQTDGNWRLKMDGTDLVIQVRDSGSWTTQARFTP